MLEQSIQECDDQLVILKRLRRKLESQQRIAVAERKAKVRKLMQRNYKYEFADLCQTLIERGIIDETLKML